MTGVILAHWRIVAAAELQYRAHFTTAMLMLPFNVAVAMGGVWVVFAKTDLVAGWTAEQMLVLVGVSLIVQGIIGAFVVPSMHRLVEDIGSGNLDHLMLQPHDAQVLSFVRVVQPWELANSLAGLAVVIWGMTQLDVAVTAGGIALAVALMVPAVVIVYAILALSAMVAFWSAKTNIVSIVAFCFETGKWPLAVYPRWLALGLTFVIPAGVVVTVPSEALTGRLNISGVLTLLLATAVLATCCRAVWKIALRSYTSASS